MLNYLRVRKVMLDNITDKINRLNDGGYISDELCKKNINKKIYLKKSFFKLLNDFDFNCYGDLNNDFNLYSKARVYGKSQLGKDLIYYVINEDNYYSTIFITGAVHGFEGDFNHDGILLMDELTKVASYYYQNEKTRNVRFVIAPLCNPDGCYDGYSDTDFGRCTYNGVDINRDFKDYEYKAIESTYLKQLIDAYKPDIFIDVHGWLNALYGDLDVIEPFYNNCLIERKYSNQWGENKGYIMGYTHKKHNCKSALIEFPSPKMISAGRIISSINELIFGYENLSSEYKNVRDLSKTFCDLSRLDTLHVKKIIKRGGLK